MKRGLTCQGHTVKSIQDSKIGSLIPESTAEESCSPFPKMPLSQTLTLVPVLKKTRISMNGNEPQAMSKDLILDNGCVVVHQDLFHSHGWHLPNKTITHLPRPHRFPIYPLPADTDRERPLPRRMFVFDWKFTSEQKYSAKFQGK